MIDKIIWQSYSEAEAKDYFSQLKAMAVTRKGADN
jgi:hypothetical protein